MNYKIFAKFFLLLVVQMAEEYFNARDYGKVLT